MNCFACDNEADAVIVLIDDPKNIIPLCKVHGEDAANELEKRLDGR